METEQSLEQLNNELRDEYGDLEDQYYSLLNEVDNLLDYIDELEKEVYFYIRKKDLSVKQVVDELIYKGKCIREVINERI